jgi:cytochrome c-type biogenesis protein CcmH/NrfF
MQVPLTRENWSTVLLWAFPILLVDEVLKAIGRKLNRESGAALKEAAIE